MGVKLLGSPRVGLVAVMLGVLLCAPSLGNGLALDDVLHAARVAEGDPAAGELFALFGGEDPLFASADAPWWRHEAMRLALWRPLAAWTHLADLRLLAPVWMHVHSLLWYALLIGVAGRVYGRLMTARWAVGLARLLFAVDHSHGMVVGWLAARSGLIGASLGLLALLAHLRWRDDGWRPGAALAPGLLFLGLLASEGAVAVCGFFAAHMLCCDRGRWPRRLLALIPAAVVVIGWRAYYTAAGFGAGHSGFYFDPGDDPLGFVVRSLIHGVLLVWSQVFVSAGEALGLAPGLYGPGAVVAAVMLVGVAALLRAELRGSALLRFWCVGTLLSALPLGSTLPTDRQLLLVGFGVFGFAAQLAAERSSQPARRGLRWLAGAWWVLHGVLSPLLLPLRSLGSAQVHAIAEQATSAYIPASPPARVILLRVPSDLLMLYARADWRRQGRAFPDELRYLYAGLGPLTVTRVDARTIELRPEQGWLYAPLDRLFRGEQDPFVAGQRVVDGTMSVEVVEVSADGRPRVARMRFDRPLEDAGFAWSSWESGGPAPFVLPEVGASRSLAAMENPMFAGAPEGSSSE